MKLSYCKTLQRAWDRYDIDHDADEGPAPSVRVRAPRATEEQKVKHLTDFMALNKEKGITVKAYEGQVGLNSGSMVTYTKWLMTGRLPSVHKGELIDFFVARWAANKVVKREIVHAE